jgi:AcrR family transcriptional regulator
MVGAEDNEPTARRKRPPLVTPEQAVQAAYQLVAAEGPAGLSMRKLAAALHVSLPTVYTAIRSKDHLITEIQDRLFVEITDAMNSGGDLDAQGQLIALGRAVFEWADRNPRLADFLLAEDTSVESGGRLAATAPEPGRTTVRRALEGILGPQQVAALDPVTAFLYAAAVSRGLLSVSRSGRDVSRDVWLEIWSDAITGGLRRLAQHQGAAA